MLHSSIELWLMQLIGSLAGTSTLLDGAMQILLSNDLLKGVPFGAALLLLWAVPRDEYAQDDRQSVLRIVLATALSLAIGRAVQNIFESPRPIMVPELTALYPPAFHEYRLDWNSFPSDHIALYFTIALGVYGMRRALGIGLIAWCLGAVGFSRMYAGYHYPLDILGGMAVAAFSLALVSSMRAWLSLPFAKVVRLAVQYPALSTAAMFLLCFQIATVFNTVRELGTFGRAGMRMMLTAFLR
ncbi:MAG: phosphatase PAP2 family protein [Nitrospinae bacterium]|nr:phosphatase PAP2 family protein [Nitrospinota bacterium]